MKVFKYEALFATVNKLSILLIPLAVFPPIVIDPFNVPKMILITGLGTMGVALFFVASIFTKPRSKVLIVSSQILAIFLLILFVSFLLSDAPLSQQLWGTFGRNIGLLSLIGSAGIVVSALYYAYRIDRNLDGVKKSLLILNIMGTGIAVLQFIGLELFKVNEATGKMIGTLGNSNFQGTFLSILATLTLSKILFSKPRTKSNQALLCTTLAVQSFLIYETFALQSLLSFLGVGIFLLIYRFKFRISGKGPKTIFWTGVSALLALLLLASFMTIRYISELAILNTLKIRTYYWSAGLSMMLDKPLSGVGLDSFGDWYLYFQPPIAYRSGVEQSDASHNIFIDFGAWGGFPLFIVYLSVQFLVLVRVIHQLKRKDPIRCEVLFPIAIWLVLFFQSLVTVVNLGFYVFVCLTSGWILGQSFSEDPRSSKANLISTLRVSAQKINIFLIVLGVLTASLSSVIAIKEVRLVNAVNSNSAKDLSLIARSWPELPYYSLQAAGILKNAGLIVSAAVVQRQAVQQFPRFYRLQLLGLDLSFSERDREKYKEVLEFLNPSK